MLLLFMMMAKNRCFKQILQEKTTSESSHTANHSASKQQWQYLAHNKNKMIFYKFLSAHSPCSWFFLWSFLLCLVHLFLSHCFPFWMAYFVIKWWWGAVENVTPDKNDKQPNNAANWIASSIYSFSFVSS